MGGQSEKKKIIAYLGPASSYTHQAAAKVFVRDEYILQPEVTIPDVFHVVQVEASTFGVVPFENSSNGSVIPTLDCFIDRENDFNDISVCGEVFMDVRHCLVGYLFSAVTSESRRLGSPTSSGQATPTNAEPSPQRPRSQPLTDISHVRDIYSHPQALGQCQSFLNTYLKKANQHETTSTSEAAKIVKDRGSPSSAAISSLIAAEVHGLSVLAKDIQDREDNTTRFLLLQKGSLSNLPFDTPEDLPSTKWKSLLVFSVDHQAQGALAKALLVFEKQQLNLTHFTSRPSHMKPWHYMFICECECRGNRDTVAERTKDVLAGLQAVAESRKCLGFWRDNTPLRSADSKDAQ